MLAENWDLLRLVAFAAVMAPTLVVNLRNGDLPNWSVGAIFASGVVLAFLHGPDPSLPWIFWIGGTVVSIALYAFRTIPGGVLKFVIAFLPWFFDPSWFLGFFIVGFGATAAYGHFRGGTSTPVAPGFLVAGLVIFGFAVLS